MEQKVFKIGANLSMVEILSQIFSIVGAFAILDSFLPQKGKNTISEYIFGFRDIPINNYEFALVEVFIGGFIKNGKTNFIRVLIVSLLVSPMIVYGLFPEQFDKAIKNLYWLIYKLSYIQLGDGYTDFSLLLIFSVILGFGIISAPFDYINILVGKYVYINQTIFKKSLWLFVIDFFLSFFSLIVIFIFLNFLMDIGIKLIYPDFRPSQEYTTYWWSTVPYLLGSAMQGVLIAVIASSLFYYFVRILAVILGLLLRLILITTTLNRYTILWTNAHEVPFTFLSLVFLSSYYVFKYFFL